MNMVDLGCLVSTPERCVPQYIEMEQTWFLSYGLSKLSVNHVLDLTVSRFLFALLSSFCRLPYVRLDDISYNRPGDTDLDSDAAFMSYGL